jgi:hypothetical protein
MAARANIFVVSEKKAFEHFPIGSNVNLCPESNLHWSHSNFKLLGIEFSLDLNRITEINFSKKIKEVSAK